ncbi:MAG: hypothetical protein ACU85U_08500, partial [Gammaproteobacteria bacterium]
DPADERITAEERQQYRLLRNQIHFLEINLVAGNYQVVEDTTVTFDGNSVPATRVSFNPYANDPKRALFEAFADKSYSIVVSDDIPGYIFSIETVVPGAGPDDLPLIREVLQLVSVEAAGAGQSAGLTDSQ